MLALDASVALSWAFDDEWDALAEDTLDIVSREKAAVPSIWPFEIANALVVAQRRNRITTTDSERFLALVGQLPVEVEPVDFSFVPRLVDLAREYGLSAYDAAYLSLAVSLGCPLASRDDAVRQAAEKAGVHLYLKVLYYDPCFSTWISSAKR